MFVSTILILISLLFVLFIQTFSDNLLFYRSPTQIKAGNNMKIERLTLVK